MDQKEHIDKLLQNYEVNWGKDKDQAWADLVSNLDVLSPKETTHPFQHWMVIAAAFIAAFLLFGVLADSFLFSHKYMAGNAQKSVWLKDSSFVMLNPNSELKVNYSIITGKRNLELKGEALFRVTPGKSFTVRFAQGEVKVLGTRFIINDFMDLSSEIYCLSGKVLVKSKSGEVVLTDDKGTEIKNGQLTEPISKSKEKVVNEFNGEFSWESIDLKTVFAILEDRFGYEIKAQPEIKNRKFSGSLNVTNLKSVCKVISMAMDLHYSIDEKNKIIAFEDSK